MGKNIGRIEEVMGSYEIGINFYDDSLCQVTIKRDDKFIMLSEFHGCGYFEVEELSIIIDRVIVLVRLGKLRQEFLIANYINKKDILGA